MVIKTYVVIAPGDKILGVRLSAKAAGDLVAQTPGAHVERHFATK